MIGDGLRNFAINIRPLMDRLKNNEKVTKQDKDTVVQFYLEVLATLQDVQRLCAEYDKK